MQFFSSLQVSQENSMDSMSVEISSAYTQDLMIKLLRKIINESLLTPHKRQVK
jgi:hypothetical protein